MVLYALRGKLSQSQSINYSSSQDSQGHTPRPETKYFRNNP